MKNIFILSSALMMALVICSGSAHADMVYGCSQLSSYCGESRCPGSAPNGRFCTIKQLSGNKCFCWEPLPSPPVLECPPGTRMDYLDDSEEYNICIIEEE